MLSQKGDLVLLFKSSRIFLCPLFALPLAHLHPRGTLEQIIHQMNGQVFLGGIFFFLFFFFNSLLDSANQYDYVTCHTSPPAIIKEGTGTQPKLVGCAGLAILLLAHSQARLSWLWNCTFSSAAEPPSRMNVWGPFQGKKKTHRMTRYFWACSEKAVESTSPKKYFVRENYYHSLSSPWAVTYRFFGLVFLFWVCFVLFFSPPEKTRIRFLPSLYC